ncbi:hypothetical protein ACP70R_007825 [Stipagrostis hirtigluma subsp. patula]
MEQEINETAVAVAEMKIAAAAATEQKKTVEEEDDIHDDDDDDDEELLKRTPTILLCTIIPKRIRRDMDEVRQKNLAAIFARIAAQIKKEAEDSDDEEGDC